MNAVDDTALWQRSSAGDGEAFALLFDRHHARVHRHAHRLTADRHDAEDLTAGSFLELWRRRQRVQLIDGSVLPWLLVTTSNLARNHARGLRRYRDFLARLERAPVMDFAAGGEAEGRADVDGPWARALAQLSAADLRLVTLVVLEEHSLSSAATLLGLTPQAAKSRLHRARQRLRAAMPDVDPHRRPPQSTTTSTTSTSTSSARTLGEQR